MGEARVRRPGYRFRRARRLRGSRRGVVAVIGTLLALLVFFAIFGLFLTQYLPLWMTDNESQFTNEAATSFAQLKAYADSQYLVGGPAVYGTPFQLSSGSVPLLAQPTQSTLAFLPATCPGGFYTKGTGAGQTETPSLWGQPVNPKFCVFQNITLNYGPGGSGYFTQHVAEGVLEMQLPNRYYSAQTFYFEDDAVIQSQSGTGEIMTVPPVFNVTTVGSISSGNSNTTLTTSFLQLYGNASTVLAQGSQQVFSHLRYTQTAASSGKVVSGVSQPGTLNVTYEIGTENPCAWQGFLMSEMNTSGLTRYATSFPVTGPYFNWNNLSSPTAGTPSIGPSSQLTSCSTTGGATTEVWVNLYKITYATAFNAGVQLVVGVGGT